MDFQTIILKLQKFWGEQKCILTQPYDIEKGAGAITRTAFSSIINSRLLLNLRRIIFRSCTCKALPNLAFIRTSMTSAL